MTVDRRSGVTLIEALTVLAIVTVLGGIGIHLGLGGMGWVQPVASTITAARLLAVTRGSSVTIGHRACAGADQAVVLPSDPVVLGGLHRGLQFTPDGLPRTCDGGGVANTTILLEHRGRQAAVIVSSLGRVRWEPR